LRPFSFLRSPLGPSVCRRLPPAFAYVQEDFRISSSYSSPT
jgi:hypothetical protein